MRTLIIVLLAATTLAGCTAPQSTGTASIYVKDAPVDDFDEIHLVFTKVEIHGNGNWTTLFENETGRDIDLLALTGDKAAFLGEDALEPGRYQQIRVHAAEAYGVKDGNRTDFLFSPTPFKTSGSFEVSPDMETRITVDIDLSNSVKETGQGYRMTPVIGKTFSEIVEDDQSGEDVHEEGEETRLEELQ